MTTVRLATLSLPPERKALADPVAARPALLSSYVYLKPFLKIRPGIHFRDWALDSGAFSAYHLGTVIDLQEYIDTCKRLRDEDELLAEGFSLDVIGDWRASLANTEAMWKQGVEAIPCYHVGEPEDVLRGLARDYPKIALGGAVGMKGDRKIAFAKQCFARVWPKKVHGFGYGSKTALMAVPWHSVDATNWESGPTRFGTWKAFGGQQKINVRGSAQNLRPEVDYYLGIERAARVRWAREMAELEAEAPVVRLSLADTTPSRLVAAGMLDEVPT